MFTNAYKYPQNKMCLLLKAAHGATHKMMSNMHLKSLEEIMAHSETPDTRMESTKYS